MNFVISDIEIVFAGMAVAFLLAGHLFKVFKG
jgi:hypothetical protein